MLLLFYANIVTSNVFDYSTEKGASTLQCKLCPWSLRKHQKVSKKVPYVVCNSFTLLLKFVDQIKCWFLLANEPR